MAYQGQFWHWDMLLTGLDWKYFNWQQMEFFGNLNLLKTGLVFADRLNTVSPRYAEEIQSAPLGCGLEGVLQHRRDVLSGIVNGVDYREWDPATDPHLPANYDADDVRRPARRPARPRCKPSWACRCDPKMPLVAFIGRLTDQKGIDLLAAAMRDWVAIARRAMGHPGHGRAGLSRSVHDAGRAVSAEGRHAARVLQSRWPIASRPAPTCSSCPAATSPAG